MTYFMYIYLNSRLISLHLHQIKLWQRWVTKPWQNSHVGNLVKTGQ